MTEFFELSFDCCPQQIKTQYDFCESLGEKSLLLSRKSDGVKFVCKKTVRLSAKHTDMLLPISCKGIAKIVEYIPDESCSYIIREYFEGISLDRLVNASIFTEEESIYYSSSICDILSELYSASHDIIHGNLKPENVIIRNTDVFLTDIICDCEGEFNDIKYDIRDLGILLRFMISGSTEINAENSSDITTLSAIVKKCVVIDTEYRFRSVELVKTALLNARPTVRNKKNIIFIIVAIIVAAICASAVMIAQSYREDPNYNITPTPTVAPAVQPGIGTESDIIK